MKLEYEQLEYIKTTYFTSWNVNDVIDDAILTAIHFQEINAATCDNYNGYMLSTILFSMQEKRFVETISEVASKFNFIREI